MRWENWDIRSGVLRLLQRWSEARAQKIDEITPSRLSRLDIAVSEAARRADYTAARAARLDALEEVTRARMQRLDADVSGRATQLSVDTINSRLSAQRAGRLDSVYRTHSPVTHGRHEHDGANGLTETAFEVTGGPGILHWLHFSGGNGGFRLIVDGAVLYDVNIINAGSMWDARGTPVRPGMSVIWDSSCKLETTRDPTGTGRPASYYSYITGAGV